MIKILEGENSFLSSKKLHQIINELKKEKPNALIRYINADTMDASEIIQECYTQDIFNPEKIIIIRRLLENPKYKEIAEKFSEDKDLQESFDIVIWESSKIPKNTKYYKAFNKLNCIESFNKFNKGTFVRWAKEQIMGSELDFENGVLEDLIVMANYDPNAFMNEIEKLKILGLKKIKRQDLTNFTNDIHDYDIWQLIDAINKKDNQKEIIDVMLTLFRKNTAPPYILVMLARNLKQIILANKLLEERKTDKEIISILKIPPFTLPKIKSIAQSNTYANLQNIYEKIYRLDYEIKTGNLDGELGLILLTTRF